MLLKIEQNIEIRINIEKERSIFGMAVMPFPYGILKLSLSEIGLMLLNRIIKNIDMYAE